MDAGIDSGSAPTLKETLARSWIVQAPPKLLSRQQWMTEIGLSLVSEQVTWRLGKTSIFKQLLKMNDQNIELHATTPDDKIEFYFKGFGTVVIHRSHADFWHQLQKLPAHVKMKMMGITEAQAQDYTLLCRRNLINELQACFAHKGWRDRIEGEKVDFSIDSLFMDLFEVDINKRAFMQKLRREKFTITEMEGYLKVFTSQKEIYSKTFFNN